MARPCDPWRCASGGARPDGHRRVARRPAPRPDLLARPLCPARAPHQGPRPRRQLERTLSKRGAGVAWVEVRSTPTPGTRRAPTGVGGRGWSLEWADLPTLPPLCPLPCSRLPFGHWASILPGVGHSAFLRPKTQGNRAPEGLVTRTSPLWLDSSFLQTLLRARCEAKLPGGD